MNTFLRLQEKLARKTLLTRGTSKTTASPSSQLFIEHAQPCGA